jgi:hypothetical protein
LFLLRLGLGLIAKATHNRSGAIRKPAYFAWRNRMIKTQELKTQIEELTKQNDMMLQELEHMKRLISNGGQSNQDSSQQQDQSMQAQDQQDPNQEMQNQQGQGLNRRQKNNASNQPAQLANDLLQIKDLVAKLEQKTQSYVSSQSNGSLTDKDVVNLVLTLINGMVDWASEFVSGQASGSGQTQ